LGFEFKYSFDKNSKTASEAIVMKNTIVAVSDELTKNKWKFIFKWNMYQIEDVAKIFGDDVKKELGL
jgi:hypothetical protein